MKTTNEHGPKLSLWAEGGCSGQVIIQPHRIGLIKKTKLASGLSTGQLKVTLGLQMFWGLWFFFLFWYQTTFYTYG